MIDPWDIEAKLKALNDIPRRNSASRYYRWGIIAAAATALPIAYFIDTRMFPVVGHSHVLIYESPPNETHIQLVFDKRRDCQLVASDIFITGNSVKPVETTTPMRTNRPVGRNIGPKRVLLVPRETFIENGTIIVRHQCHWFWTHRARMY